MRPLTAWKSGLYLPDRSSTSTNFVLAFFTISFAASPARVGRNFGVCPSSGGAVGGATSRKGIGGTLETRARPRMDSQVFLCDGAKRIYRNDCSEEKLNFETVS